MKMNVRTSLIVIAAIVAFIGGANWIVSAIRGWSEQEHVYDILEAFKIPHDVSRVLYLVIGIVTILLSVVIVFHKQFICPPLSTML